MNILIFNGSFDKRSISTSQLIVDHFKGLLIDNGHTVTVFNLAEGGIPLFDVTLKTIPVAVEIMLQQFRASKNHIWLTPLYHGGMTGVMKNCLDWLEMSANDNPPYLTDKIIGLVCWADGPMAMQAIAEMSDVAHALRAWPLPFSIPIAKSALFEKQGSKTFCEEYKRKFSLMADLMSTKEIKTNILPFYRSKNAKE